MRISPLFLVAALAGTAVAGPTERRVNPSGFAASSMLPTAWDKFVELGNPGYAGDDDAATAWVEGAATSGAGEWIRIAIPALDKTTKVKLKIRNGAQKSKDTFAASPRVKDAVIHLMPSNVDKAVTLEDKQGWLEVAVDQPSGPLTGVELRVKSVYEGAKSKDLAISDVQVFATSETPDNAAFERDRAAAQRTWRANRALAAKNFGKAGQAPVYGAYDVTSAAWKSTGTGLDAMIAAGLADRVIGMSMKYALVYAKAAVADFDKLQRVALSPKLTDTMPNADGVQVPSLQDVADGNYDTGAFRTPIGGSTALVLGPLMKATDVKDKLSVTEWAKQTGPCKAAETAWIVRGEAPEMTPGATIVKVLVVGRCGMVQQGRTGAPAPHREREIYVFNPDNEVVLVVGENHVEGYTWGLIHGHGMIRAARSLLVPQGKAVDAQERDAD